jgi:hypothetical protein
MNWKFTLIDSSSVSTVVESPVGWNGIGGNLTRNIVHHGININISTDSFEWVGEAYGLLYTEYQTNGANGQYQVQIDYECAEGDGYTNYFIGAFDFNTFERQCSDYCFIKISVTASKCTDVFMSRMGQDVDIEATTNFDGQAITPPLLRVLNIEGQDIFLQNKANHEGGGGWNTTITDLSGLTGNRFYDIPIYLPNTPIAEMGNDVSGSPAWNVNNFNPNVVAKNSGLDNISFPLPDGVDDFDSYYQFLYLYEPGNTNCVNQLNVEWRCKGDFELTPNYNGNVTITLRSARINPITNDDFVDLGTVVIGTTVALSNGLTTTISFDETFSGLPNQPQNNSFIHYYWHVNIFKSSASGTDTTFIDIVYDGGSTNYYNMEANSACPATVATSVYLPELLKFLPTAYMDDDCPSVVMEEELNQCLDFYQITKGSFIRQVTEPSVPKLFVSYEYLFEQCRKIFNIGWGFDNNETELKIARIEHFYKSTIVVDVGLVDKAIFTTAKDLIYGTIMVGYNKWEAEEFNGLDEMNTERQYRRNIDSNPTELDLMADIISAGYTIEVTRRKNQARTGTSDWRYDDDLFIVNANVIEGNLYAYRGIDANPDNVYSPNTRMNYALTPARSLMRWFKSIAAAQPTVANENFIFTSGTGNYIAQGQMLYYCPIEGSTLSEKETIDVSNFDNDYYITPIWKTEYVTFTAPFSMADFEDVKVNPYGAIRFRCSDTYYIGNIVEINHDPNEGLAEFKLLIRR